MARIVVITNGNYFARVILSGVLRKRQSEIVHVIVVGGDYRNRTGLHAAWHLAKCMAPRFFLFKLLLHLAQRIFETGTGEVASLQASPSGTQRILITEVSSVEDPRVRQLLEDLSPDLLISVSCPQRIGHTLLSLVKRGGINIHSSLLPAYAGLAPYLWVLANGERVTGTTVHWMTHKWDQGNILVQKECAIEPGVSVFHLFEALARLGDEALVEAVELALAGAKGSQQNLSQRSYYSHPTAAACRDLKRRGYCFMRGSEWVGLLRGSNGRPASERALFPHAQSEIGSSKSADELKTSLTTHS